MAARIGRATLLLSCEKAVLASTSSSAGAAYVRIRSEGRVAGMLQIDLNEFFESGVLDVR